MSIGPTAHTPPQAAERERERMKVRERERERMKVRVGLVHSPVVASSWVVAQGSVQRASLHSSWLVDLHEAALGQSAEQRERERERGRDRDRDSDSVCESERE